ncbi:amino acid ABC transporter permease [Allorhizobium sp. BGMRC 0089]|uniref:amino acid ABC transporter permease n=1 Tax=Allorhizobium sonneratiae TaxID=2934936 RepID=UPI0020333A13|nr:amino acid ABC transporter permease [Allorhizobium sonneratiae]MCM2292035.1 amino acid ABC transporter permease [Allorhizobium sonneratiae]
MHYVFHFGWISEYYPIILKGIGVTVELTLVGGLIGISLGMVSAWCRTLGPKWLSAPVGVYVELIRNTPFMIQLFFIFFGLPSIGFKLTEMEAANLAMVVNLAAYACEIIRAGIEATPKGQFEAGAALALKPLQTFRLIILIPALQRIWPALSSQLVIVMLGSAVVSQIAAQDLTYAANYIQSRTFRAFEAYTVSTVLYLLLAILLRQLLALIGSHLFPKVTTR